jgi:hypothetical protein
MAYWLKELNDQWVCHKKPRSCPWVFHQESMQRVREKCLWILPILILYFRKLTRRNPVEYSLSRNYQLNENVLTMQLILPLDVFYACFYSLHIASVIVIRSFRFELSNRDYVFYYYLADTVKIVKILKSISFHSSFFSCFTFTHLSQSLCTSDSWNTWGGKRSWIWSKRIRIRAKYISTNWKHNGTKYNE